VAKYDIGFVNDLQFDVDFDLIDDGVQTMSSSVFAEHHDAAPFEGGGFPYTPLRPMLILFQPMPKGHHDPFHPDAVVVAEVLRPFVPTGFPVVGIGADGPIECSLQALAEVYWMVAAYVPAVDPLEAGADPRTMQHIVARLRQPDGCPWDRKQTHQSLRNALIEETYEIVDAINTGDAEHLAEELGDMFCHILMQAQIAHEAGEFSIEDDYRGITKKIVGRHPHVFGNQVAVTDTELSGIWAEAKAREKADSGKGIDKDVDGEPFSMPALTRATRVLRKHPVAVDDNTPVLLRVVAEIISNGGDPEEILKQQLRDHVAKYLRDH
jgi:MazG family protein